MPERKSSRRVFDGAASGRSQSRDGHPDPASVARAGIKTREAIDWMASREPDHPAPQMSIDDEDLRRGADTSAQNERRETMNALRQNLRDRSRKGRKDFETGRAWRGEQHER